ncbi:MAG: translation initiation factor [Bdellovibrionota bacterium]
MSNRAAAKDSDKHSKLVYSTDPRDQSLLPRAVEAKKTEQKIQAQKSLVDTNKFIVVFRIETQGRGGKTVTVLDKLPAHETFLKELTKELKIKCGVGGSCRIENQFGMIEIQGDKRELIKKILDQKLIKYKGM